MMTTRPLLSSLPIRRTGGLVVMLAATLVLSMCTTDSDEPGEPTGWESVKSPLSRDLSPDATNAEIAALTQGGWALTVDLYGQVADGYDDDLMISPFSIRSAFAMVYAGARGTTAEEMAAGLHYDLADERLHVAFNAVDLALADRNDPGDADHDPIELAVANAFWGQSGYPWEADYLDVLAINYGAGIEALDFHTAPEASRLTINGWVEDKTHDRIQDLLPPGSISAATAAVLTNAVYFKAPWEEPFDEDATADGPFHRVDGTTVTAPMMYHASCQQHAEGVDWQAVELDFRQGELGMLFVMPAEGAFEEVVSGLDASALAGIVSALAPTCVEVTLPRFEFEFEVPLKAHLMALGMVTPFTGAADLSGMLAGGGLFIDEAYHKTFVAVDEKGAEAAAATAVVINETSVPTYDAVFVADRPFLFAIRDRATGALLFFGRVMDPT